ncbi:MAG TPA: hypothetical protein VHG29_01780 [Novosphingobium sp.]|nr:hypothetical protein [Novosphingobium sp.]
MRIPVFLLAALGIFAALPAAAQQLDTSGQRLELLGDAPAACVLNAPTASNAINSTFGLNGFASGRVGIVEFVNPQTAQSNASSIELSFPVICNSPHRMVMRSANGGMLRAGASSITNRGARGFSEFLPYELQLGWAGQALTRGSDAGSGAIDSAQAGTGDMNLRISTPAGSGPFVAGTYNDTIVIELHAAN